MIPLVWLGGTALSISALLLPVAGAAAGFLFERFVKGALDFVGPREDRIHHCAPAADEVTDKQLQVVELLARAQPLGPGPRPVEDGLIGRRSRLGAHSMNILH